MDGLSKSVPVSPENAKPPSNLSTLQKLAWIVNANKYEPTPYEKGTLEKCFADGRWYYVNSAVAVGAPYLVCLVDCTASGRLAPLPRIILTISAAVGGNEIGTRYAGYSCIKNIVSGQDCPMRGELIAILREDFPSLDIVKTFGRGKETQDVTHGRSEIRDQSSTYSNTSSGERLDKSSEDGPRGKRDELSRIPRLWNVPAKESVVEKEPFDMSLMSNPFELIMPSITSDDLDAHEGTQGRPPKEIRRSRMSPMERKEYDRKQYERRQAVHQDVD